MVSWVLYDLANTIFSMNISSLYFSLYIRDQVGSAAAYRAFTLSTAISMGIIFVFSPVLGALTDRSKRRLPFLTVSTLICIVLTALLGQGGLGVSLTCYVLANIAYQAGLQFYDSLLPEVSTEETRGWVGGIGIGVGYLGSFIGLGAGMLLLNVLGTSKVVVFQVTAALFLLFSLPALLWIEERGNPNHRPMSWAAVRESAAEVRRTFRESRQYPGLLRFLIGRAFYTDAINTVVFVMGIYVTNMAVRSGLSEKDGEQAANIILAIGIGFGVIGGFLWGRVADRLGPKRTLDIVLWMWVGCFLLTAMIGLLDLPLYAFYPTACVLGLALGGTWAADRPYLLRLSPPDRVGEFYGLYGMVGRFSAITGPIVWFLVVGCLLSGQPRIAEPVGVLTLMLFVVASYFILRPVSDHRRTWTGADAEASARS